MPLFLSSLFRSTVIGCWPLPQGGVAPVASVADCPQARRGGEGDGQQREREEASPADRGGGAFVVGDDARGAGDGCERQDGDRCAMKTIAEHLPLLVRGTFVLHLRRYARVGSASSAGRAKPS